jgi:hypothetical protein
LLKSASSFKFPPHQKNDPDERQKIRQKKACTGSGTATDTCAAALVLRHIRFPELVVTHVLPLALYLEHNLAWAFASVPAELQRRPVFVHLGIAIAFAVALTVAITTISTATMEKHLVLQLGLLTQLQPQLLVRAH